MAIFSRELLSLLRQHLSYDPITGLFTRLIAGRQRGQPIGVIPPQPRLKIHVAGQGERAHIIAYWFMTDGPVPDGHLIDHRNRDDSDNRWQNLRAATKSTNQRNANVRKRNKSGVMGVYERKLSWEARIVVYYKIIVLGWYNTFEDAVQARLHAELKYFGEITSTHMTHLYDADATPVPRKSGQWRKEQPVTWSLVDGKRQYYRGDEPV